MPTFAIMMFILFSYAFSLLVINDSEIKDIRENIGGLQVNIFEGYGEGFENAFYLDQAVKYSSFKTLKGFGLRGGVPEECNNVWKFNSNCEPNLISDYLILFNQSLNLYGYKVNEIEIEDNRMIGKVDPFYYEAEIGSHYFNYTYPLEFSNELVMDLESLEELRKKIESCLIENKDFESCVPIDFTVKDDMAFFSAPGTNELFEEDLFFVFQVNLKDTGI